MCVAGYCPTVSYKYICLSQLANCRSQLLFDRLETCFKLFVSTDSTFSHEFASQFGIHTILKAKNIQQLSRRPSPAQLSVYEPAIDRSKRGGDASHGRAIASGNMSGGNSDKGDRLRQNVEKQQAKRRNESVYLHCLKNVI